MQKVHAWVLTAAAVVAVVVFGLSQLPAQRDFRTSPRPESFERYKVVNVTEGEIILLDVTNGELSSAKPKDVKPHASRPVREAHERDDRKVDDKKTDDRKTDDKKTGNQDTGNGGPNTTTGTNGNGYDPSQYETPPQGDPGTGGTQAPGADG